MKTRISISPWRMTRALLLVILGLILASAVARTYLYVLRPQDYLSRTLISMFNLAQENNVPTWYSSSALLLCSLLLALIASAKRADRAPYVPHWWGLAIVFLFLSLDETASIHETTQAPLRSVVRAGGLLYQPWVLVGGLFAAIVALASVRFLVHLPPRTRLLFLGAGAVYVGAAVGLEAVGGYFVSVYNVADARVVVTKQLEESFEMLGIAVFVYALLSYMSLHVREVTICIEDEARDGV